MKLGLLGSDAEALAVVSEVVASEWHQLIWAGELGAAEDFVRRLAPEAEVSDSWESLLAISELDGLIVARGPDEELRADQLRKIVQDAVPMLVMHPVHTSMLVYYELDMIGQESGADMLPYLPARYHPAWERMRRWLAGGWPRQPGSIEQHVEQIVIERSLEDRRRESVLRQFAIDADLVQFLCGPMNKVSAMAPPGEQRYANLGVQLSGPGNALARWSVLPVERQPGARVTLLSGASKATLWMPDNDDAWQLNLQRGSESISEQIAGLEPEKRALEALERVIAGEKADPTWQDASRSVELAEAIDRSLAKGRTIELHDEDYTEQATFKGTMTSVGCGVLMAALVMLPVAAVAAKLGIPWARYWAWILLAVLGLFLLLQGLRFVFPREEPGAIDASDESDR